MDALLVEERNAGNVGAPLAKALPGIRRDHEDYLVEQMTSLKIFEKGGHPLIKIGHRTPELVLQGPDGLIFLLLGCQRPLGEVGFFVFVKSLIEHLFVHEEVTKFLGHLPRRPEDGRFQFKKPVLFRCELIQRLSRGGRERLERIVDVG